MDHLRRRRFFGSRRHSPRRHLLLGKMAGVGAAAARRDGGPADHARLNVG